MEESKKKVLGNMSWLMGGRIINMILAFFIGLASDRYLKPGGVGTIQYVAAYVSFFSSIASLGLSVIVIKEVSMGREDDNEVIWTGILLRLLTAVVSAISVVLIVGFSNDKDPMLIKIALLESVGIIASAFDTCMYWFQGKMLSKYVSIAGIFSYLGMSMFQLYLLSQKTGLLWFALATSINTVLLSAFLMACFIAKNGFHPRFSLKLGKRLMKQSYHYMISGLIAVLYSKIDTIMLNGMLNKEAVGYYNVALKIAGLWGLIPSAFIQSVSPVLYKNADENRAMFLKRLKQSYAGIWLLNVGWSLGISIFSYWILYLYGKGDMYLAAQTSLVIVVWYSGISCIGSLTQVYLATENKNKYVNRFAVAGLITDVILNLLLIPRFGPAGAAVATLVTYTVIHIVMPLVYRDTREAGKLIVQGMLFQGVVDEEMKGFAKKAISKIFRKKR